MSESSKYIENAISKFTEYQKYIQEMKVNT